MNARTIESNTGRRDPSPRRLRGSSVAAHCLLAVAFAAAAAAANARETPQEPSQADFMRAKQTACSPMAFRVLPGDFNFCLSQKYWDKGDYHTALELMDLAAGWGNKSAQAALGVAYFNGDGAREDRALGLAWLALASERQDPQWTGMYLGAMAKASDADKAQAARLYQQMRGKYADEVAAARADKRYTRTMAALAGNPAYSVGACLSEDNASPIGLTGPDALININRCSMSQEAAGSLKNLEMYASVYFAGWKNHVDVGSVESIKDAE